MCFFCLFSCVWMTTHPFSLPHLSSNFLFLHAGVCVCLYVCSEREGRKRKACETSEFLWLQPSFFSFLPSSLFLSPYRQLWIWHLNEYESGLFFFLFLSEDSHTPHKERRRGSRVEVFSHPVFFYRAYQSLWKKDKVPQLHSSCLISGTFKHDTDDIVYFSTNPVKRPETMNLFY